MYRRLDDLPWREMQEFCTVAREDMHGMVLEHEHVYHANHGEVAALPDRRSDLPSAVPFVADRIPDADLARMVEVLETQQDVTVDGVACTFGYPPSLTWRELARYKGCYDRYVFGLARS